MKSCSSSSDYGSFIQSSIQLKVTSIGCDPDYGTGACVSCREFDNAVSLPNSATTDVAISCFYKLPLPYRGTNRMLSEITRYSFSETLYSRDSWGSLDLTPFFYEDFGAIILVKVVVSAWNRRKENKIWNVWRPRVELPTTPKYG